MLTHRVANLLEMDVDAIGQGVNVVGVMGAGIAVPIRRKYGEAMYHHYRSRCQRGELTPGHAYRWDGTDGLPVLFNLSSQRNPGPDASTQWLGDALNEAATMLSAGQTLAIPWIGAGIGGLDHRTVATTVRTVASRHPHLSLIVVTAPWDPYPADNVLGILG